MTVKRLTKLQLRALHLLAEPSAFCRQGWTRYEVRHGVGISSTRTGKEIAAGTLWSLVNRKFLRYSVGDFTITDDGRAAVTGDPS